ncbi:MAG: viral A-type inclusion protein [Leptotrichia sp.]|uniref:viral A-type inclusion protein n=1 Tax=Leptotrichia sp. oral taxon 498 TaxID=712368 RepID=UPI000B8C868A|nr:viral A-type inclusion protein [Leptotrichia sp. oral taxon 498]ASQ48580.1 viral A-type inclusion protein [Leptotrichia sp. oral taxon 498]RKW34620.1 MAG: viral A-type inclusion protein [Leptotrichia sp.]
MKKIKNLIIYSVMVFGMSSFVYSYEDYYEKVYIVKVSKGDIFKKLNVTKKQQKKLEKIFDKYQNKAKDIEKELITFEEKKEKIGKIEIQRYEEIAKILTNEQLEEYNSYINSKKQSFNEKIDRIKKLEDNVSLSNEQKAKVLKFERDFKRNVEKLKNDRLSVEMFTQKYEELKQKRNEQIRSVLTDEQSKYFSEN